MLSQHKRFGLMALTQIFALQKLLLCWERYMKFRTPPLKKENI